MSDPLRAVRAPVERIWSAEPPQGIPDRLVAAALTPLSWAWAAATAARNAYFDRIGGTAVDGIAVVSFGNLVVGGTGKTPLVADTVRRLRALGARPAVVLRGYGRDEVLLHRRWHPDVPVVADPMRARAVERARALGADVAVLDDGFQHRRLTRDLDLVLLAAEDPFPGRTMPRGRYRESIQALARADGVILTRRAADAEKAREIADSVRRLGHGPVLGCAHLRSDSWLDLAGRPSSPPTGPVLVASSVARPDQVVWSARQILPPGTDVAAEVFADHHEYAARDLERLRRAAHGRTLIVTEKDAVKLQELGPSGLRIRVLGSKIVWDWGEEQIEAALARSMGVAHP